MRKGRSGSAQRMPSPRGVRYRWPTTRWKSLVSANSRACDPQIKATPTTPTARKPIKKSHLERWLGEVCAVVIPQLCLNCKAGWCSERVDALTPPTTQHRPLAGSQGQYQERITHHASVASLPQQCYKKRSTSCQKMQRQLPIPRQERCRLARKYPARKHQKHCQKGGGCTKIQQMPQAGGSGHKTTSRLR